MAMCRFCGKPFAWGQTDEGRWVPLVPVGEDAGLDRSFQDENGALRADHRVICTMRGGPSVRIAKLARPVRGDEIIGPQVESQEREVDHVDQDTGEIFYKEYGQ